MGQAVADQLLSIPDVAAALHISPAHVELLIRRGQLAAVRLGHRTVRVKTSALAKYIAGLPPAPFPRTAP